MSETTFTYKTILQPAASLFKDRGSKFLGRCFPVRDTESVKKNLDQLKKEHPKANHHCFAYRIGVDGLLFRTNDNGEPAGSAGKPILGQIDSAGFTNVLVVVIRYFGGTLLGVPGLIHAYKAAAAGCLAFAEAVEKDITYRLKLEFSYPLLNEVMQVLKRFGGVICKQEMYLFCTCTVDIPVIHKDFCLADLAEIRGLEITGDPDHHP